MKFQLPLLLVLATSLSAVPSDINYQGRLTDANGDAVTGDVSMSVKLYDAQSGGNEIYSEDIGTVTLDESGVYSFQFGASGNSTVTKTETIVTSDGTSTEYTGTFTNTPIDGTISVTDETYSWNDVDGNPGELATAYIIIINGFVIYADIENGGSGYDDDNPPLVTITGDGTGATATATVENGIITGITITGPGIDYTEGDITIAPPPAPFIVDKVDGNLEVGYASSPSNGTGVVATYKTLEPSIIGALSEASSHWLELTVDGTAQNPRERILSVPFAQVAGVANNKKTKEREFNLSCTSNWIYMPLNNGGDDFYYPPKNLPISVGSHTHENIRIYNIPPIANAKSLSTISTKMSGGRDWVGSSYRYYKCKLELYEVDLSGGLTMIYEIETSDNSASEEEFIENCGIDLDWASKSYFLKATIFRNCTLSTVKIGFIIED